MTIKFSIVYTIIAMTSIDVRIQVSEHRVSYLESLIEKLALEELFRRRQTVLEQYRQRYNNQLPPLPVRSEADGEDEVDGSVL